jgi:hypothetical protein
VPGSALLLLLLLLLPLVLLLLLLVLLVLLQLSAHVEVLCKADSEQTCLSVLYQ